MNIIELWVMGVVLLTLVRTAHKHVYHSSLFVIAVLLSCFVMCRGAGSQLVALFGVRGSLRAALTHTRIHCGEPEVQHLCCDRHCVASSNPLPSAMAFAEIRQFFLLIRFQEVT